MEAKHEAAKAFLRAYKSGTVQMNDLRTETAYEYYGGGSTLFPGLNLGKVIFIKDAPLELQSSKFGELTQGQTALATNGIIACAFRPGMFVLDSSFDYASTNEGADQIAEGFRVLVHELTHALQYQTSSTHIQDYDKAWYTDSAGERQNTFEDEAYGMGKRFVNDFTHSWGRPYQPTTRY
jgi:hypothetical protein